MCHGLKKFRLHCSNILEVKRILTFFFLKKESGSVMIWEAVYFLCLLWLRVSYWHDHHQVPCCLSVHIHALFTELDPWWIPPAQLVTFFYAVMLDLLRELLSLGLSWPFLSYDVFKSSWWSAISLFSWTQNASFVFFFQLSWLKLQWELV